MKFAVKALSSGKARVGVLQLGSCPYSIETPALLLTTRKGLPVFIPPDHLPSLPSPDSHLLQFSPLHFLECVSNKTISDIGGLHQMLGLNDRIFAAVPRDCIISIPEHTSTNRTGASFETPCGRSLIKPAAYMEMISSMMPNLWTTLADEVPAWVSDKRNRISVDRTVRWLDDCLTLNLLDFVSQFFGYWIGGFGLGESMDERTALLSAVTESLPQEKPRQICGLELPELLGSYIYNLTLGGFALTFPLERTERHNSDYQPSSSDAGCDETKINLKATIYRHNTHHYLGFFRCIREAIKEGTFEQYREKFIRNRLNHVFASASA
nr:queuine tRNA-ribosyltransferase accessory subunit 2-like [Ipomoea trifida]